MALKRSVLAQYEYQTLRSTSVCSKVKTGNTVLQIHVRKHRSRTVIWDINKATYVRDADILTTFHYIKGQSLSIPKSLIYQICFTEFACLM